MITYTVNGKRAEKIPDALDFALIEKIENSDIPYWFPTAELPDGYNTRQPKASHGITNVHLFYTKRNLWALRYLKQKVLGAKYELILTGIACRSTQMNRIHMKNFFFGGGGWNAGYLNGTLYIPSIPVEITISDQISDRLKSFVKAFTQITSKQYSLVSTCSFTRLQIVDSNSVDYLFIDPPFGLNLNYSELNFIWESWLKVITNNKLEAIENSVQGKGLIEYRHLMTVCFKEAYRVLKSGLWHELEGGRLEELGGNEIFRRRTLGLQKACKLLDEQTLWGQTVCCVWLPSQDTVVRLPRSALQALTAQLSPELEGFRIASAAKVAEVLEGGSTGTEGSVLWAPMECNVIPLPDKR